MTPYPGSWDRKLTPTFQGTGWAANLRVQVTWVGITPLEKEKGVFQVGIQEGWSPALRCCHGHVES